uniref:Phosphatidylinositol N-acetylglucosaminyltransferase subunit Q n=1 Tax=Arcella intermedia TaxID=1963864 RepID=A0A6B2LDT9_9EUKA
MGWPAGLKLNEELDVFLGNLFLVYIEHWSVIAHYLSKFFPVIIKILSVFGFLGLSSILALTSDLISFLTMHIYWLYTAMSKAFSLQLSALSSLWLLFRGKKRNVLKNRIDSCNYTIDELLLGTLLFCILVFLLPTMGTYYLFFLVARTMILIVHWTIASTLVLCDYFPFFPLILYFGRSSLLSGGVRLELCPSGKMATRKEQSRLKSPQKDSKTEEDEDNQDVETHFTTVSTYLLLKPNPNFSISFFFQELSQKLRKIK